MNSNLETVKRVYDAYGRRDASIILALVTPDTEWWGSGPPGIIPWAGPHKGLDQVARYVAKVLDSLEDAKVEFRDWIVADSSVVVLGQVRAKARPTGRHFQAEFAHVWTLRDGKVSAYRNYVDTAAVVEAFRRG